MSDDQAETPVGDAGAGTELQLRREALLPNERSRGLGTVAVVCTMAGVASGLALATTLMAMQVADTMSTRHGCSGFRKYEIARAENRAYLGIRFKFQNGYADVNQVSARSPADAAGFQVGDHILSVNDDRVDSQEELEDMIFGASPGSHPVILIEREGRPLRLRPTLSTWPEVIPVVHINY